MEGRGRRRLVTCKQLGNVSGSRMGSTQLQGLHLVALLDPMATICHHREMSHCQPQAQSYVGICSVRLPAGSMEGESCNAEMNHARATPPVLEQVQQRDTCTAL